MTGGSLHGATASDCMKWSCVEAHCWRPIKTSRGLQMSRPRSRIFVLYNCLWNFMWLENLSEIPYVQVWITIRWFHFLFFLPSRKKGAQKGMNPTFHLPNVKLWRGDATACWVVQLPRQPSARQVVCMGPVRVAPVREICWVSYGSLSNCITQHTVASPRLI